MKTQLRENLQAFTVPGPSPLIGKIKILPSVWNWPFSKISAKCTTTVTSCFAKSALKNYNKYLHLIKLLDTHWKSINSALFSPIISASVIFSWKSGRSSNCTNGSLRGDKGKRRNDFSPEKRQRCQVGFKELRQFLPATKCLIASLPLARPHLSKFGSVPLHNFIYFARKNFVMKLLWVGVRYLRSETELHWDEKNPNKRTENRNILVACRKKFVKSMRVPFFYIDIILGNLNYVTRKL